MVRIAPIAIAAATPAAATLNRCRAWRRRRPAGRVGGRALGVGCGRCHRGHNRVLKLDRGVSPHGWIGQQGAQIVQVGTLVGPKVMGRFAGR